MMITGTRKSYFALLGCSIMLAGCSGAGTGPTGGAPVILKVASRAASQPAPSTVAFDVTSLEPGTFTDGANTLVLTRVELVLLEIELKRADREGLCSGEGDDDCEELELQPRLLEVPLSSGPERSFTASVAPGRYDEIEFEIHKPEDGSGDDSDAGFLQQHPEFAGVSVRVEGSWNGEPFTFMSDVNAEQEVSLDPVVVVSEGGGDTELTLFVDLSTWFADGSGSLVDPRTATEGGSNQALVENNIKGSIDVFEDRDDDGRRDDDADGSSS
jgi:hypothetical protein